MDKLRTKTKEKTIRNEESLEIKEKKKKVIRKKWSINSRRRRPVKNDLPAQLRRIGRARVSIGTYTETAPQAEACEHTVRQAPSTLYSDYPALK